MEPVSGDNALERGLHVLERQNDPELVKAYRQFMERLETLVGRDQLDTFAMIYQRDRRQLNQQEVGASLSPEEQLVRDKIAADPQVNALYDQYLELAKGHGTMDPTFESSGETDPIADESVRLGASS